MACICHARIKEACASHMLLLQTNNEHTSFQLQTAGVNIDAKLDATTGSFSCTCPDYRLHTNPCKHLYWLAIYYFKAPIPDQTKSVRWDEFISTVPKHLPPTSLSTQEKAEIVDSLKNTAQRMSARFTAPSVMPRIDENSECGICLTTIITRPAPRIHWCRYGCGATFHEACGSQLRDKTCPNCRAPNFYVNKKRYRANLVNDDSD